MDVSEFIYDWNEVEGPPAPTRGPVIVDDETLRDGLQSPSIVNPPIEDKLEILRAMARLGIQRADLGLPGAGPFHRDHIDQMLGTIVREKLAIAPGCAVRTLVSDIEPLVELSQRHGISIQASAFLGTSRLRQFVEGWDLDRLVSTMEAALTFARNHQIPVMFVTEDTTRSHPEDLRRVYGRALELGARELCVADTVGHSTPAGVHRVLGLVRRIAAEAGFPEALINWHGHSDRGLAVANALAAVDAGADVIHGTGLGIGERVGNTAMDQLLVNLKLMGRWDRDLSSLGQYCRTVSNAVGVPIPRNYPVVGQDAFETATGVHAAAVVKAIKKGDRWLADRIYSAVPATEFGLDQVIRIGPMSGRSNVIYWLEKHGFGVTEAVVGRIFERAKASPRLLEDGDILQLVQAAE